MSTDFSFDDRIARRYDMQRAHPPAVSTQVGEAVASLLGEGARVLEIGVGTGRIARPVADAGCAVVGFDLSRQMLAEVGASADTLDVLQADMHYLPFEGDSFQAAMAVHVLHLASDLAAVLREVARVLEPGGAFIQGEDWMDPQGVIGMMRNELRRYVIKIAPDMKPPAAGVSKKKMLADLGATETSEHIAAEWTVQVSPNDWLGIVAERMDPESWILPEPMFAQCYAHLQEYAAATWDDLDEPHDITRRFTLTVTRGAW